MNDILEKYILILREKELLYKDECKCDSGWVAIEDAEKLLKDLAAEIVLKFLRNGE